MAAPSGTCQSSLYDYSIYRAFSPLYHTKCLVPHLQQASTSEESMCKWWNEVQYLSSLKFNEFNSTKLTVICSVPFSEHIVTHKSKCTHPGGLWGQTNYSFAHLHWSKWLKLLNKSALNSFLFVLSAPRCSNSIFFVQEDALFASINIYEGFLEFWSVLFFQIYFTNCASPYMQQIKIWTKFFLLNHWNRRKQSTGNWEDCISCLVLIRI